MLRDKTLATAFDPDRYGAGRGWEPSASEGLISEMIGAVSRAMADDVEAQLRARQVDAIKRLTTALMLVHLINGAALCFVLELTGQMSTVALIWFGVLGLAALHGLAGAYRGRGKPAPRTTSQRTVNRVVRSTLVFGLIWSVPGLTFLPALSGFAGVFGYALLTGMMVGGAFGLYPIPAAAMAYILPLALSGVAGLGMVYGPLALGPAIAAAMFLFIFHKVIRRHADLFNSEFIARIELEKRSRLIGDLLEDARLEALGTRQMIEDRLARAQKIEAVGQLTAGIAHNFNNLLTTIQGNAELLERDGKSDATLVEPILAASRQGAEQVQRLLSVAGKQMLRPEPVALGPLIDRMVQMSAPALGPSYRILSEVPEDLPAVFADPAQLENALLNIVLNARDAMPEGGDITISCRKAGLTGLRTRFSRKEPGGMVEIGLSDTGQGMDATTLERATDPFFSTKAQGTGTGLGLSSVAGFARQSQGDIAIDSAPGEGTTVVITLPAAREAPEFPELAEAPTESGAPLVLLVEDLSDVRDVTATMLKSLGYRVEAAAGPDEAIARVTSSAAIDIVLTDLLLSSTITGIELAAELRRMRPGLPVAFMSGWSQERADTPDGALRILSKPFTRSQLDTHLRTALAESPGRRTVSTT